MAPIRSAALLTILGGLAALAAAFAAEWWGHLVPCALCLLERWPYRIVIGLGIAALILPPRLARVLLVLGLLAMLGGVVLAVVHVGVEYGLWPSPLPECAAPHLTGSIAERLAQMPARPQVPCGTPVYPLPWVPVSMAALQLLYALAFCLFLAISVARPIPRRRAGRRGFA
jgi:disulfide bond formation protein DsbB